MSEYACPRCRRPLPAAAKICLSCGLVLTGASAGGVDRPSRRLGIRRWPIIGVIAGVATVVALVGALSVMDGRDSASAISTDGCEPFLDGWRLVEMQTPAGSSPNDLRPFVPELFTIEKQAGDSFTFTIAAEGFKTALPAKGAMIDGALVLDTGAPSGLAGDPVKMFVFRCRDDEHIVMHWLEIYAETDTHGETTAAAMPRDALYERVDPALVERAVPAD